MARVTPGDAEITSFNRDELELLEEVEAELEITSLASKREVEGGKPRRGTKTLEAARAAGQVRDSSHMSVMEVPDNRPSPSSPIIRARGRKNSGHAVGQIITNISPMPFRRRTAGTGSAKQITGAISRSLETQGSGRIKIAVDMGTVDVAVAMQQNEDRAAFLGLVGLILAIAEAEILLRNCHEQNDTTFALKCAVSFTTLLLLWQVYRAQQNAILLLRISQVLEPQHKWWRSAQRNTGMLTLCMCAIHAPPGVNFILRGETSMGSHTEYTFDAVVVLFMLLRVALMVPLVHRVLGFHSAKAMLIARWNNVDINVSFTFKALLAQRPIVTLSVAFASCTIVFAYALRVFELGPCAVDDCESMVVSNPDCWALDYRNCVWNTLITMTTVGYGDLSPSTDGGKAVAVIVALLGMVFISLLCTVTQNSTALNGMEEKVFDLVLQDERRYYKVDIAASLLQAAWSAHTAFGCYGRFSSRSRHADRRYALAMAKWRRTKKRLKQDEVNTVEKFATLPHLSVAMRDLEAKLDRLLQAAEGQGQDDDT